MQTLLGGHARVVGGSAPPSLAYMVYPECPDRAPLTGRYQAPPWRLEGRPHGRAAHARPRGAVRGTRPQLAVALRHLVRPVHDDPGRGERSDPELGVVVVMRPDDVAVPRDELDRTRRRPAGRGR